MVKVKEILLLQLVCFIECAFVSVYILFLVIGFLLHFYMHFFNASFEPWYIFHGSSLKN